MRDVRTIFARSCVYSYFINNYYHNPYIIFSLASQAHVEWTLRDGNRRSVSIVDDPRSS